MHLREDSQELTTFRTPFGRYCFQRLPFGLSVSQDIFQQCMDDIIAQVPGCVGIADDIAVIGRTEKEHDTNLMRLFETAQKEGLVFNSSKCHIIRPKKSTSSDHCTLQPVSDLTRVESNIYKAFQPHRIRRTYRSSWALSHTSQHNTQPG